MTWLLLQLSAEGLSNLWWTPTDCSGAPTQILLSPMTYDITPPTLAIIEKSGKKNVTLAQSTVARHLRRNSRKLQYFTLTPTSSSSITYGANVVFSFSEAVTGFGEEYAFIKGGALSDAGLNETKSQQQYSATIVADNTKSALLMVTGSESFSSSSCVYFSRMTRMLCMCFASLLDFKRSSADGAIIPGFKGSSVTQSVRFCMAVNAVILSFWLHLHVCTCPNGPSACLHWMQEWRAAFLTVSLPML